MWSDHHGASQKCLQFLSLTIETHCLPSSIFIEHLQCTRHNRTYRRHCPCSWGAYILRKNTPLVEWHFCLVFSVKYWGNTRWGVSFGCDLAPSLLERRRKDFKRETVTDHSGQGLQGDKHKLNWGAGLQERMRGGCGMQAEEGSGYLRHWVEPERSCGLFPNTWPPSWNGWWQDSKREVSLCPTWK